MYFVRSCEQVSTLNWLGLQAVDRFALANEPLIGRDYNKESLKDMPIKVPTNPHPIAPSAMKRMA